MTVFSDNDKLSKINISTLFAYRRVFKTAAKSEMVSAVDHSPG